MPLIEPLRHLEVSHLRFFVQGGGCGVRWVPVDHHVLRTGLDRRNERWGKVLQQHPVGDLEPGEHVCE